MKSRVIFINIFSAQVSLIFLFFAPSAIFSDLHLSFFLPLSVLLLILLVMLRFTKGATIHELCSKIQITPPTRFLLNVSFVSFIIINIGTMMFVLRSGSHQALYTEGYSYGWMLPIKIMSMPAYYFAIALAAIERRSLSEKLAWITIVSTIFSGSRGLLIFAALSILIIRKGSLFIFKPINLALSIIFFAMFVFVGYVREPIDMDFSTYLALVFGSLNQFAFAGMMATQCEIPPMNVLIQFIHVFLGVSSVNRVSYGLTECFAPGAVDDGYGIASSLVAESVVIAGDLWIILAALIVAMNSALITLLVQSKSRWVRMVGLSLVPFVLYAVRTEIVYPYVFFLKIASIVFSFFVIDKAFGFALGRINKNKAH